MVNWWLDRGLGGFRIDAIINIKKALPFTKFSYAPDRNDGLTNCTKMLEDTIGLGDFLTELKNKTSEVFHDTLPAKLISVDDIEKPVTSGFDIFPKNDFIMYGKKYVDYGKNFTHIGDQAYQLDMSTGTLE